MKIYGLDVQDALYQKPELCSQQQQINLTLLELGMVFVLMLLLKTSSQSLSLACQIAVFVRACFLR